MTWKNIDQVILNYLTGAATQQETRVLHDWLNNNESNRKYMDEFCDVWQAVQLIKKDEYDSDKAWQKFKSRLRSSIQNSSWPGVTRTLISFTKIAAVLVLVLLTALGITLVIHSSKDKAENKFSEYIVPLGSRSQIILPDGSSVWLNAGSRLRYAQNFNKFNRNVFLDGEGFFDVAKNKELPFNVKIGHITIKVVGTAFNVKAYAEDNYMETTVERGVVKVFNNYGKLKGSEEITLYPKQKIRIDKNIDSKIPDTNSLSSSRTKPESVSARKAILPKVEIEQNVNTEIYTSWKDKRWIIQSEPLESLAVKISRRYNVSVIFKSDELKKYIFSGILQNETLEQVLELIKLTAPIRYTIERNKVILMRDKRYKMPDG